MALKRDLIAPFEPKLIKKVNQMSILSYGLSSFGYDIRLSSLDFRVFRRIPGQVIDPKHFDKKCLEQAELKLSYEGNYFILPALSYGLGVAFERIVMPPNVSALCIGKSTYARMGIIANLTLVEPSWEGHLTLELSNSSAADCKIYADEGIVQLMFFQGDRPLVNYAERLGKYQDQPERVVFAKV